MSYDPDELSEDKQKILKFISHIGMIVDVRPAGDSNQFIRMMMVCVDEYGHLMLTPVRDRYQIKPVQPYADWMANG